MNPTCLSQTRPNAPGETILVARVNICTDAGNAGRRRLVKSREGAMGGIGTKKHLWDNPTGAAMVCDMFNG